ncbi:histidyl-tRNA synthetase [Ignicoccus pacificus DSM 13166]|uniref:Histidine--tRNA ligase n=1 Tax=Ignicoccus pacificus DSM 13166 TaxID=940294 RepID=A0A977K9N1_9CREN|nr:histidyl-tRNA synthetase [Ignicoccus pacificus DSM 13166]
MKFPYEPIRGFRDLFGEESCKLAEVFSRSEELARRWGFERTFLPTVERFALFAAKSGEEIRRTMFVFKDKAGREVALRPEATASVVRAYLHSLRGRSKPIKLFTLVNVFRYDEPQFARYREFYQADFEVLGSSSVLADAELVTMLDEFYEELGIDHVIVVGSVKALRGVLEVEGIRGEEQDRVLHFIDKGELEKALELVRSKAKDPERASRVIEELATTEGGPEILEKGKELLGEEYSAPDLLSDLEKLIYFLPDDVLKRCKFKLGFARGLAYYTGLIYEVKVPGFPVSVAGGGRYDLLTQVYGGEPLPATGFAIGLDRTALAWKRQCKSKLEVIVIPIGEEAGKEALLVQRKLSELGFSSTLLDEFKSVKKAFSYAASTGAKWAVVIGRRELQEGSVVVKNLERGVQVKCPSSELLDCLLKTL